MKNLLVPIALVSLFAACSDGPATDAKVLAKRAERDSLKTEREKITARIADVEEWIARHDPDLKRALPAVTTLPVVTQEFSHWTEAHGNVRADQNAMVYTSTGGEVRRILVQQGQSVRKGAVIVDIDTDALRKQVEQAKVNHDLARTIFERQSKLWDEKVGSEVQFLEAKSRKEAGEAQYQALQEQLRNAQVIAPFDGVVDEIFPNLGDMASPMQPVARVVALGKASIEVDLAEDLLTKVKLGDPVQVVLPETQEEVEATIDQIGQYINPNNRTFKVYLRMGGKADEAGARLRPNQLANVRIRDLDVKDALVLPSRAVMENGKGESYVYVLEETDGVARSRKVMVKVLSAQSGQLLIETTPGGLKGGDVLIDQGSRLVVDKQEVQVLKGA